ncbi:hypothetical protein [Methylomonas albis]|nr:hypothetical protein [Methylomonas albis]CAD6879475.1 hypothetical protein [Methylomonas albis]
MGTIVKAFSTLREDFDKERRHHETMGQQIQRVMYAKIGIYGDL